MHTRDHAYQNED